MEVAAANLIEPAGVTVGGTPEEIEAQEERLGLAMNENGPNPGEPVFVPRPGACREDDGVLLTLVLDAARGLSALVVLDATTLEERARAVAPHAVPAGFHGEFWGDPPPPNDDGAPPTG